MHGVQAVALAVDVRRPERTRGRGTRLTEFIAVQLSSGRRSCSAGQDPSRPCHLHQQVPASRCCPRSSSYRTAPRHPAGVSMAYPRLSVICGCADSIRRRRGAGTARTVGCTTLVRPTQNTAPPKTMIPSRSQRRQAAAMLA